MPEDVKYQLILSEEDKLQEALDQFEKMESLKPILDSQAFQGNNSYFEYNFSFCDNKTLTFFLTLQMYPNLEGV